MYRSKHYWEFSVNPCSVLPQPPQRRLPTEVCMAIFQHTPAEVISLTRGFRSPSYYCILIWLLERKNLEIPRVPPARFTSLSNLKAKLNLKSIKSIVFLLQNGNKNGLEISVRVMIFRTAISILQLFAQGSTLQTFLHIKWGEPYLSADISKLKFPATKLFETESYV